jgi:Tfp pilus assembly protein PilV
MVSRGGVRAGHSLPELLVAMTFLAATLAAMASTAVLATRWTSDALLRQRALSIAEAALDSLAALPVRPTAGGRPAPEPPWIVRWEVTPADAAGESGAASGSRAAGLQVTVTTADAPVPAVELRGLWIPSLPALP